MLSTMRRHAKSWFIKIALGAIVIVFTFWGVGSYNANQGSRAALVNGDTISVADFQRAYRTLLDQARQQFGTGLNEELIKRLNLRKQAMDGLVSQQLMLSAASREGVIITDQAVLNAIENSPGFQADGRFSPELYRRVLNANRYEPASYEQMTREQLTIQRVRNRLVMAALVGEAEARDYYHWQTDQVKISYVAFNAAEYEGQVKATEEALAKYYGDNREAYRIPEQVRAQYLTFAATDYLDKVALDWDKVREIYDMTMESFAVPAQVKLSHILLSLPQDADDAAVEAAKAQAEDLIKQIKEGADFAELAKQNSKSGDAAQGGELDWMPKGRLLPELDEAAFKLAKGELSQPIRSRAGYHILRLDDSKEARTRTFEEVKDELATEMRIGEASELALTAAEEAYGLSAGATDLNKLAEEIGKKAEQVGPFSQRDDVKGAAADPKFVEAAFEQPEGEVGSVIEGKDAFYLILVTKKSPSYVPDLDKVKEEVTADFKKAEAKRLAKEDATGFLAEAKKDADWLKLVAERTMSLQLPPVFTRNAPIEGLGFSFDLGEAAFGLNSANPFPDQVFEVGDKAIVFRFENRLPASDEVFEKRKDELIAQLTNTRQQAMQAAWLELLRKQAEIEIDERFL